jgi:hypothetical protein
MSLYYVFIQILIITYLVVFVSRSVIKYVFTKYLEKSMTDIIDNQAQKWVNEHPNDEWILVNEKRKNIKSREIESTEFPDKEIESENDMIINEKTSIFSQIWGDNSSVFEVMIYGIISIFYIKYMLFNGRMIELIFGLLLGSSYHLIHLIKTLILAGNDYIMGKTVNIDISKILTENGKYRPYILIFMSLITTWGLLAIKTTYYSRILGEWIFDSNSLLFFASQIIGYLIILNILKTINMTSQSPYIIGLMILYTTLIFIIF